MNMDSKIISGAYLRKHRRVSLKNDTTMDVSSSYSLSMEERPTSEVESSLNSFKRRRVSLDPLLDLVPSEPSTTETLSINQFESRRPATTHSSQCDSRKLITPSPSTMSINPPDSAGESYQQSPSSSMRPRCETPESSSLGLDWEVDDNLSVSTCSQVSNNKVFLSQSNATSITLVDSISRQNMSKDFQLKSLTHSYDFPWHTAGETRNKPSETNLAYLKQSRTTWREIANDVLLLSLVIFGVVVLGHVVSMGTQLFSRLQVPDNSCIYVSGGGFSGFWFSLGRLHSIAKDEMTKQSFACYSAGCLGVVAVYTNRTMPDLYAMASGLQREWKEGSLHRYHIVQHFVDDLLEDQDFDEDILSSLHILTSIPQKPMGFRAVLNTPRNMEELRTMLIQTTWIPVAVGSEFTYEGHLDGAFSVMQHPICHKKVGLASDWTLLTNTLNVNLGKHLVEQFWQMGLDYGI